MHKSVTFSGRLPIWKMSLSMIKSRPIIGYGSGFSGLKDETSFWISWLGTYGPHNQFLAIALAGGVITLAIYIVMLIMSTIKLTKLKDKAYSVIISVGFLATFIELSLTFRNMLNCIPLYLLIIVAYNMYKVEER
jgi:O-antigen ligase